MHVGVKLRLMFPLTLTTFTELYYL